MLQFLESGQALYVLAGICLLGILTRLMTRHHYKRLLKESVDLSLSRHKMLKELLQKAESTYRMNQGMPASAVWVEHQLNELRVMGLTLPGWNGLSLKWTWLCLLTGGAGAFLAYWYRLDSSYIVMYGGGAILFAMLTMFFDGGTGENRQEELLTALQDHLDNVVFPRLARGMTTEDGYGGGRKVSRLPVRSPRGVRGSRDAEPENQEAVAEPTFAGRFGRRSRAERGTRTDAEAEAKTQETAVGSETAASVGGDSRAQPGSAAGNPDVDHLRRSLEQIAASREHVRPAAGGNWLKDLGPDEVELIGDILRQYLA